jgi:hypothetical protein
MHDLVRVNRAMLPWLLPLVMVLAVLVTAFAPPAVIVLLGVVVFGVLGFVGVPWYYRHSQRRNEPDDRAG